MTCNTPSLPLHLIIKILSLAGHEDLDTRRIVGIPPGRVKVSCELQLQIETALKGLQYAVVSYFYESENVPFIVLYSPKSLADISTAREMYTIFVAPSDQDGSHNKNIRYLVRIRQPFDIILGVLQSSSFRLLKGYLCHPCSILTEFIG